MQCTILSNPRASPTSSHQPIRTHHHGLVQPILMVHPRLPPVIPSTQTAACLITCNPFTTTRTPSHIIPLHPRMASPSTSLVKLSASGRAHQEVPPVKSSHPIGSSSYSNARCVFICSHHWARFTSQYFSCPQMIRASRSPHHRARASAMASRTVTKSAIPITNPNKPPPETVTKESDGVENGLSPSPSGEPSTNGASSTVNHPSSTVAPVAEAPRPTATKPPENSWSSLDMGGVQIKHLPPTSGLFSFTFLINLYLNHNALTTIPPEIARLRHLELLDLSGNNLQTLPPELGMLTKLKELYLFDNHIATIPPELGTLHQLQTLGIEGNPLEPSLKAIVQKEGTPALISFLRDSCPIPAPPPSRSLRDLLAPGERDALLEDPNVEVFSVLCFNILCEMYATERLYGYTPSWALEWSYRRDLIMAELLKHQADFLCLQEVQTAQYEEYFVPKLGNAGYEGVYYPKSRYKTMNEADRRLVDGSAVFFNKSKYVYPVQSSFALTQTDVAGTS